MNIILYFEINIDISEIPLLEQGKNITLDSPLLETKNWLNHVKNSKLTCVDVETYHILKTIKLFVSNFL